MLATLTDGAFDDAGWAATSAGEATLLSLRGTYLARSGNVNLVWINVTSNPTAGWIARQTLRHSLEEALRLPDP